MGRVAHPARSTTSSSREARRKSFRAATTVSLRGCGWGGRRSASEKDAKGVKSIEPGPLHRPHARRMLRATSRPNHGQHSSQSWVTKDVAGERAPRRRVCGACVGRVRTSWSCTFARSAAKRVRMSRDGALGAPFQRIVTRSTSRAASTSAARRALRPCAPAAARLPSGRSPMEQLASFLHRKQSAANRTSVPQLRARAGVSSRVEARPAQRAPQRAPRCSAAAQQRSGRLQRTRARAGEQGRLVSSRRASKATPSAPQGRAGSRLPPRRRARSAPGPEWIRGRGTEFLVWRKGAHSPTCVPPYI